MQPVSEPEQHQPCAGDEPVLESIGCNDHHLDEETLKTDNELIGGGSPGGCISSEKVSDPPFLGNELGPIAYTVVEDSTNGNKNNVGNKTVSCSFPLPHFEMVRKEMGFYMDKQVTEIELPEVIVCYKEGSYHIIKDVCIDEGAYSCDKVLVEHESADQKCCDISQLDTRHECTNEHHISNALKSLNLNEQPISDVKEDSRQDSSGILLEESEVVTDTLDGAVSFEANEKRIDGRIFAPQESDVHQFQGSAIDIYNESVKQRSLASFLEEDRTMSDIVGENVRVSETEGLLTVEEVGDGHCHVGLSSVESSVDQPYITMEDTNQPQSVNRESEQPQYIKSESYQLQHVKGDSIKLPSTVGNNDQLYSVCNGSNNEQADEITSAVEESHSTISDVSSEENKARNQAQNLSGTDKSGSDIIAFDVDPELPTTGPKKDINGVSEFQHSVLVASGTALDDATTNASGALTQTSHTQPSQTGSSSLGPASLSNRIAYVGQIPYSGSISLRSDSSTTSTRSFAFPILQSEWNSSPVKMARADRRHFKKHRLWTCRLLCCRF